MNVYFKFTYEDGTTEQRRIRQTPNWETLKEILEHYRSMANVKEVTMEIE
jgi:hypothetical protein